MRCILIGAGGHGRVVLDILASSSAHEVVGFVDSDGSLTGQMVNGIPILGQPKALTELRAEHALEGAVIAVGDNRARSRLAEQAERAGLTLVSAIHHSANIAANAELGCNVVVAAGALVCAHCRIGDSAILNTGCIVDHESMIGRGVHICPGAKLAGRVIVDAGAFVGIGATVIQNVKIGRDAIIGAGAVVIHDVAPHSTVVGVPARQVKPQASEFAAQGWALPNWEHADRAAVRAAR